MGHTPGEIQPPNWFSGLLSTRTSGGAPCNHPL